MDEVVVRALDPADFDAVMALEDELFGRHGEKTLGPFYVRLCCDLFADSSFVACAGDRPVGYILSFVRGREAFCSTLAILPEFQRTRAVFKLAQALICAIGCRVDTLWFTVHEDNRDARALHATLGAKELEKHDAYFGVGEPRILSRIDRPAFEKLRARMERIGLIERAAPLVTVPS